MLGKLLSVHCVILNVELILGYVFWCLFQGLAPMIWFYPLNDLEISGYEAYAALWFLQVITGNAVKDSHNVIIVHDFTG